LLPHRTALRLVLAVAVAAFGWLPLACARSADPKLDGVVLIVLDTLRADGLSVYGNPRPTSPRIDAWAAQSVVFERALSAGTWTLPGTAGLLSGRVPSGKVLDGRLRISLVETLREAGYRTAAFVEGGYVSSYFGIDRGFDEFVEQEGPIKLQVGRVHLNPPGEGIEETFGSAADWLRASSERPFFLMVHTYEVHTPYRRTQYAAAIERGSLDETFETEDADRYATGSLSAAPAELAYVRALYDGGVAVADREVGRLLDTLAELGLAERTLVVLTSDHGEDLGDRAPLRMGNHGHSAYDEMLRVPLIIRDPRPGKRLGRIAGQVRSVDVMPTILDLLGVPLDGAADGRSLAPLMRGEESGARPAYVRIQRAGVREMVSDGSLKLIRNAFPIAPAVELYDLEADPTESENRAGTLPEQQARLDEQLAALRASIAEAGPPTFEPSDEVPADVRKRLNALGYGD
jgi:arylsulfatase A-like enzyme